MTLGAEQRRLLGILADAEPRCATVEALMAHGFAAEMLAGLAIDGLARASPTTVMAGGRAIEVTRVRITDAGRRAIEV